MGKEEQDPNYLPVIKKESRESKVDRESYRRWSDRKRKVPTYFGIKTEVDSNANESVDETRQLVVKIPKLVLDHIKTEFSDYKTEKRKSESYIGVQHVRNKDTLLIIDEDCPTVKRSKKSSKKEKKSITKTFSLKFSIPLSKHYTEDCLIVQGSRYDKRLYHLEGQKNSEIIKLEKQLAAAESKNKKLTAQNKSLQQVRKGQGWQFTTADLRLQNEQLRQALQDMSDVLMKLHYQKCGSKICIFDSSKEDVALQAQIQQLTAANQFLFQSLANITKSKGDYKSLAWTLLRIIKHGANFQGTRLDLMQKILSETDKSLISLNARTDQNKECQKLMNDLKQIEAQSVDCNANEEPATEGQWHMSDEQLSELYAQLFEESVTA